MLKIIVIKESIYESIITDIFTFLCIAFLATVNHVYLKGSWLIDLFVIFSVVTGLVNYKKSDRMTVDQAIEHLHKIKEIQNK